MTRLALSIVTTLLIYLAYQALAAEAMMSTQQQVGPKSSSSGSETSENMIAEDSSTLAKLQNAWFKSAQFNRRPFGGTPGNPSRIGTYTVFRRTTGTAPVNNGVNTNAGPRLSPAAALGYLVDNSNLIDDEDLIEKRFDDYGHMRFGKRGGEGDQFDDYGHMRFGR